MKKAQEKTEESVQGFVMTNFIVSLVLSVSMQQIFSSINSFQITAHLPLINIPLSAKVYFVFDIMIKIIQFDFFPIHEFFDLGFQSTEPWDEKFEWLKYDSTNFIELSGSVLFLLGLIIFQGILVCIAGILRKRPKSKFLADLTDFTQFKQGLIRFFIETYFELIISLTVSYKMFKIYDMWGTPEWVAFGIQTFMWVMMVIFTIISLNFLLCKQSNVIRQC